MILAIINWLFVWGKYFLYFYGVLDVASIITEVMGVAGGVSTTSAAGAAASIGGITDLLKKVVGKFTIFLPASLFVSSILNSALTFWPLVYYPYSLDHSKLGAFYSVCEAFFYAWWIVGWIPTALAVVDIAMATPYGSGKMSTWNSIIIFYTAGEWLITVITLTLVFPAFDAWFLAKRILMAKEIIAEYDSPELAASRAADEKALETSTDAKKDAFDDKWSA